MTNTKINFSAITSILEKAAATERKELLEREAYQILDEAGIGSTLNTATAGDKPGPDAVSDRNALSVSISNTRDFGAIISAGVGGIDAGIYVEGLRNGQAVISTSPELCDAGEFLELFKNTFAYKQATHSTQAREKDILDGGLLEISAAFIEIARFYSATNPDAPFVLQDLTINPVIIRNGVMICEGVYCRFGEPVAIPIPRPVAKIDKLLHPTSIGIIGVSGTKMNFGRIILNNIINSGYDINKLTIIKPGDEEIDGVKCAPDLKSLEYKLDLFVVAVTADVVFGLVDEVIETDAAETVMLIPGGLGETQKSREQAMAMMAKLNEAHKKADGGPIFLGGNCLGVVSHPGNYDSWFVPQERLPRTQYKQKRNSAFISQSGAFMITRLSKNPWMDPLYMVATGNQNDITHSDMLNYFADRDEIDVIGLYIEGFKDLDGFAFAKAVRSAVVNGKDIIVYKAGQNTSGRNSTFGHTASIAGEYEICDAVLTRAGAIVTNDFSDFADLFYMAGCIHHKKINGNRLAAISGAGFETVGMADNSQTEEYSMQMAEFDQSTMERLAKILKAKKLDALMEVRNPFDINPGSDDEAHLLCTAAAAEDPNVDAVVVGLDPISPMMRTMDKSSRPGFDIHSDESIATTLIKLASDCEKPIIGIIEGGTIYEAFAKKLMGNGVCVFRATERGVRCLVTYTGARLRADKIRKNNQRSSE